MHRFLLILLLSAALLPGCGLLPGDEDPTKGWSSQRFYDTANDALKSRDYENAIKYYELLQARYPFERYAQQAKLDLAYAYFKYNEPDSAIATLDRFHQLYPRHPHSDYSYYLRGLVNYKRGSAFLEKWIPKDASQRDPGAARHSFDDFATLLRKYPDSKYVPDARQRMIYLRNRLARYEVNVANFYIRRGAWLGAANRASYVVKNFENAPAVADALSVLSYSYQLLGYDDLSLDAYRVLRLNFPDHPGVEEPGAQVPQDMKGLWAEFGLDR